MTSFKRASSQALVLAGVLLGGCALEGGDGLFTTGSLTGQQAATDQKADAVCITLAARIESLRKDGIPDKIEKAAAKRYKMTHKDLGKADQLNKANAEFQSRCSTVKPAVTTAETPADPAATAAPKKAAKATTTKTP